MHNCQLCVLVPVEHTCQEEHTSPAALFQAVAASAASCMQVKVLPRCQKPQLVPTLQELRNLFFIPVYRTDVTPDEFIAVCERGMAACQGEQAAGNVPP